MVEKPVFFAVALILMSRIGVALLSLWTHRHPPIA